MLDGQLLGPEDKHYTATENKRTVCAGTEDETIGCVICLIEIFLHAERGFSAIETKVPVTTWKRVSCYT